MIKSFRPPVLVLLGALAFAAFSLVCLLAHGTSEPTPGTREARILTALENQPIFHRDIGDSRKAPQLATIARAINAASKGDDSIAAYLIATGFVESTWSLEVHSGNCRRGTCDWSYKLNGPRAASAWQLHANALLPRAVWLKLPGLDLESTTLAATEAAKALRRARGLCAKRSDAVLATFRAYGSGRGCEGRIHRETERVAIFARVVGRL